MTDIILEILKSVGPWAALCLLLLWWIHKQLEKQGKANDATVRRLQASEDWIRGTLSEMHEKTIQVAADSAYAIREMTRTNREILEALRGRPCMHDIATSTPAEKPTEPLIKRNRDHA